MDYHGIEFYKIKWDREEFGQAFYKINRDGEEFCQAIIEYLAKHRKELLASIMELVCVFFFTYYERSIEYDHLWHGLV